MNLTRCQNGHFYDADKFSTCPHCLQNNGAQSDKTESVYAIKTGLQYGQDVTAPVDPVKISKSSEDETQPLEPPRPNREVENRRMNPPENRMADPNRMGARMVYQNMNDDYRQTPPVPPFAGGPEPRPVVEVEIPEDPAGGNNLRQRIDQVSSSVAPEDLEEKTISFTVKSTKPVVGWLVCIKGNSMGKSFNLYSGKNFIGRSLSMDVVLEGDKSVSRDRHAIVVYDPKSKKFLVEPGMSRELFYLNDDLVLTPQLIEAYQVLTVGNTELMFVPFCGEKFDWNDHIEKE